jgi:hypothetical protein
MTQPPQPRSLADTVEHGPDRPSRRWSRAWVRGLGLGAATVALAAALIVQMTSTQPSDRPSPPAASGVTATDQSGRVDPLLGVWVVRRIDQRQMRAKVAADPRFRSLSAAQRRVLRAAVGPVGRQRLSLSVEPDGIWRLSSQPVRLPPLVLARGFYRLSRNDRVVVGHPTGTDVIDYGISGSAGDRTLRLHVVRTSPRRYLGVPTILIERVLYDGAPFHQVS